MTHTVPRWSVSLAECLVLYWENGLWKSEWGTTYCSSCFMLRHPTADCYGIQYVVGSLSRSAFNIVERWRRRRRRRARLCSSSEPPAAELLPGTVRDRAEPRGDDSDLVGAQDARRDAADRERSFLGQNSRHRTQLHCSGGAVARGRG